MVQIKLKQASFWEIKDCAVSTLLGWASHVEKREEVAK